MSYTPEVLINESTIAQRVKELALSITRDFANEELVVVCVLKGAFIFCADLIKEIQLPLQLEFLSCSSYGDGVVSSGQVRLDLDVNIPIDGKNILIVEDIVDTGLTMKFILTHLKSKNPKNIKLASLLYKPARTTHEVKIDYLAFQIEDKFVVGYGLDYAGRFRELPFIGILNADH